jgi:hypothetical protein
VDIIIRKVLMDITAEIAENILIPNYFDKKHVEGFMNSKLNDDQFRKIIQFCNDHNLYDKITETTREFLNDNLDEIIDYLEER